MIATAGRVVAWLDSRTLVIDLSPAAYAAIGEPRVGDRLLVRGAVTTIRDRRMVAGNVSLVAHGAPLATFQISATSQIAATLTATLERTDAGRLMLVIPNQAHTPGRSMRGAVEGVHLGRPCTLASLDVAFVGGDARLSIGAAGDPLAVGRTVEIAAIPQPAAA